MGYSRNIKRHRGLRGIHNIHNIYTGVIIHKLDGRRSIAWEVVCATLAGHGLAGAFSHGLSGLLAAVLWFVGCLRILCVVAVLG